MDFNKNRSNTLHCCVPDLFRDRANQCPEAVAVADDFQQLSYRELNRRTNQLAQFLRTLGVGPDVMVGIAVDRAADMVVGILGILKAGGAYLPLDPDYPSNRLAFMQRDAGLKLVLSQQKLRDRLTDLECDYVWLDSDGDTISRQDDSDFATPAEPSNLAYVTYTSGSTGLPKGVLIEHHSLVTLLVSMQEMLDIKPTDVLLSITPLAFDVAAAEVLLPLVAGARLVVANRETAAGGRPLRDKLESSGASVLIATPSILRLLVEFGWRGDSKIRVHSTGEALPAELAKELVKRSSSVWNLYGPTETTVWSTAYRVISFEATIPIGTPVGNTQCYVLDSKMHRLAAGEPGELYIGGDGLARGYLNRPELTEERFIRNPFDDAPNARLYKTGDRVRCLPDGNIAYLGRLDDQVKLRGVRIEPGEIEAEVMRHPGVRACAILLEDDSAGEKQLVAYVIRKAGLSPTPHELRDFMAQSLPAPMLPNRFEFLTSFPLTPTGKTDRRALAGMGERSPQTAHAPAPPRTELEKKLAGIWCEVLGLDRVGVHDDFFEIGGQSVLAVRLIARIEDTLGRQLSLDALVHGPTIENMAAQLTDSLASKDAGARSPVPRTGVSSPFFCVGAGPLFRLLAQHLGAKRSFVSLGLSRAQIDLLPVPFKLEDIAAALVRRLHELQPAGPYLLGGWCADGVVAFEAARQLVQQGEAVDVVVLLDAENPNPVVKNPTAAPHGWYRFKRRIKFHSNMLRSLAARKRVAYVRDLLETRLTIWERRAWGILHKIAAVMTGKVPSRLRNFDSIEFNAFNSYKPGTYPSRVIVVATDFGVGSHYADPTLGWGEVVTGDLRTHSVPCGHSDLFREPHVTRLAQTLAACLAEPNRDSAAGK